MYESVIFGNGNSASGAAPTLGSYYRNICVLCKVILSGILSRMDLYSNETVNELIQ